MRAVLRLAPFVVAFVLASSSQADEPRPQHITLKPEAAMPEAAPVIELAPFPAAQAAQVEAWREAVEAAAEASEEAREEAKRLPPDTLALNERAALLGERGIDRGAQVGGNAAIGIRLGSKSQRAALDEAGVDVAVRDAVSKWDDLGALVISIVPGSPAEFAGLEPGDVVVQIAGIWIDTPDTMVRLTSRLDLAREVEVKFLRLGLVQTTWMTAIDRRDLEALKSP